MRQPFFRASASAAVTTIRASASVTGVP